MYAAYIHRTPAMIKANAQATHGDVCQIALLPADSSCCYPILQFQCMCDIDMDRGV
jgi:hypothetical protein